MYIMMTSSFAPPSGPVITTIIDDKDDKFLVG